MRLLAIDTAGPACAVAILRDGEMLARASEAIGRGHAERLMPMTEAALAEAGIALTDLDRIAVTTGPGSFTGVRVGVAAARGLALALDIPAVGIGSLDALIFPTEREGSTGTVIATLDARRGEVYALARDLASHATLLEARALPAAALASMLEDAREPLILVGAGAPIAAAAFAGRELTIAAMPEYPEITDVARLGLAGTDLAPPAPHYARAADAKPQANKALARR
jgi:tRNA threonylcarbamoyladenosine biosynthesis protein TsaB